MKMRKKILISAVTVLFIIFISINSLAAEIINPEVLDNPSVDGTFTNGGKAIFAIIRGLGASVSTIAMAYMGIRYMVGSVEERAEYKKDILPFFIGALLIFATSICIEPLFQVAQAFATASASVS